jgi:hypothetical protein
MYTRFKQVLDITANIACVIIAGFIVTALALQFVHARAGTETHTVSDGLRVGAAFPPIPGFDYKQHQKSILFFVSPDCSHCVQSLPTYQRLFDKAKALATGGSTKTLLGLFEDDNKYAHFAARGFTIPGKANIPFHKYNVRATPTIVIVDRKGIISDFWIGELSADAESGLMRVIESNT